MKSDLDPREVIGMTRRNFLATSASGIGTLAVASTAAAKRFARGRWALAATESAGAAAAAFRAESEKLHLHLHGGGAESDGSFRPEAEVERAARPEAA
jgi:hypothetical protein